MARTAGGGQVVEIKGLKELLRDLKQLEPKVAKKILRRSTKKGLEPVKKEVEAIAPRDTGALASSLKIKPGRRKRNTISRVVQFGEGFFKGHTWYAGVQEFGAPKKNVRAKHFMQRAYEATRSQAAKIATDDIRKAVDEAVREKG